MSALLSSCSSLRFCAIVLEQSLQLMVTYRFVVPSLLTVVLLAEQTTAMRLNWRPDLYVSRQLTCPRGVASTNFRKKILLHDIGNVGSKFTNTGTAVLLHDPIATTR